MRVFTVIVKHPTRQVALKYQRLSMAATVLCMTRLNSRGFQSVAETTANGITEQLTLPELLEALP